MTGWNIDVSFGQWQWKQARLAAPGHLRGWWIDARPHPRADALTERMMMETFPGRLTPLQLGRWQGAMNGRTPVRWVTSNVASSGRTSHAATGLSRGYWV